MVSVICDKMSQRRPAERLFAEPEPIPRIGRSERTRAEILDAAFEYLWSRPFRDMTVNSLMATTSISRSAFYRYFEDIHPVPQAGAGCARATGSGIAALPVSLRLITETKDD